MPDFEFDVLRAAEFDTLRCHVSECGARGLADAVGVSRSNVYLWLSRGRVPAKHEALVRGYLGAWLGEVDGALADLVDVWGVRVVARRLGVRDAVVWRWLGGAECPAWLDDELTRLF